MKNSRKILAILLVLTLSFCAAAVVNAFALATESYYICYESDGYKVRERNVMTLTGEEYIASPYMKRGDRFLISDGKGSLFGDDGGQPLTVTESGNIRYTVRFSPNKEKGKVTFGYYSPGKYVLVVGDEDRTEMTYRSALTIREEFYCYFETEGGETIKIKAEDGSVYGETGIDADGITLTLKGKYRIAFTKDENNLYADNKYIEVSEYPELYLLCEENEWTTNENYMLERDEKNTTFIRYKGSISVPKKDAKVRYSVYDKTEDKEYKPSSTGTVTVHDKGSYDVFYAPDHVYSASGDESFYVTLSRKEEFYGGWYLLGDFNGYTFIAGDENFDEAYRLTRNTEETTFEEYKITFTVTETMLFEFDGRVEFYISDGKDIHRRPDGKDIGIEASGEYEITFSPVHDYGRGYRYRYVRKDAAPEKKLVSISTGVELMAVLKECTSPEYSLNKVFELKADVDVSGIEYTPALIFAGEFDGLYRSVTGIKGEGEHNFLFRETTEKAVIRRAKFDINYKSTAQKTGLIGTNYGLVEEVEVSGDVEGDDYVGGIAAVNGGSGKIYSAKNRAVVNGVLNVGGIVGYNDGEIRSAENYGAVNAVAFSASELTGILNVGGVAGYSTGNILSSANYGEVGKSQGRHVGGIAGLGSGGLFVNRNEGKVFGGSYVGGIVGYYGRLQQNDPSGTQTDFSEWWDKYFGSDDGNFQEGVDNGVHEIYYCISSGEVYSAGSHAGGIAGRAGATALKTAGLVSTGDTRARYSYAGGIVGELVMGRVEGSVCRGSVTASTYAGGIVGRIGGAVSQTSGVVAQAGGEVVACFSSAIAAADSYSGGIAGLGSGKIEGCVSAALIEKKGEEKYLGMIAGDAESGLCKNNYYIADGEKIGGINGVSFGSESSYGACMLNAEEIMSEGMLSEKLVGLSAEDWQAGETEKRYPAPRILTEKSLPSLYGDEATFNAAFESESGELKTESDLASRTVITAVFYTYDFTAKEHVRAALLRIPRDTSIEKEKIPALKEEEGYFVWWERIDFKNLTEDIRVYQRFDKIKTTIGSDDGDSPLVLAEGKFHSDTTLAIEYNGEYMGLKFLRGETPVSYGDVTVRLKVRDPHATAIKLVRGDEIKSVETKVDGKYLVFTLAEGYFFASVENTPDLTPLWITVAALSSAVVVSAVFGVGIILAKKRRSSAVV